MHKRIKGGYFVSNQNGMRRQEQMCNEKLRESKAKCENRAVALIPVGILKY